MSSSQLAEELGQIIKGEVFSSQHPDYMTEVKRVWNACLYNKKPLMFVKVSDKNDIVETVKFCKKNKLPLCIRNGGTSLFAQEDGAVVVILEQLNKVTVDSKNKIVEVESGTTQGDVDKTTVKYHLATTLGQASFVGVTGSGLLLGMGMLGRTCGYAIDNIHSIEMITASGEIITTSQTENQELFWAMKGYGPNFGIVTKLWLNLHHIPAQVIAGSIHFPWEKAADTLKVLRDFLEEKNDDRLVLYGIISTGKERGKRAIFIRYFFNGELDKGKELLDEFCQRSSPTSSEVIPTSYDMFQRTVDDLHPFGNYYFDDKGGFTFKDLSDEAIDRVIGLYNQLPSVELMSGGACYVVPTGGAYSAIPEDSSPFMFRDSRYRIFVVCSTPSRDFQTKAITWLEGAISALAEISVKEDETKLEQVMQRLRRVKRQYDPQNIFKYNINISPD